MAAAHPYIETLLHCITLEEAEQVKRFSLDQQHSLKSLKAEGLALHPLIIVKKSFGYADYPELSFKIAFPPETSLFKDGAAVELFCANEEPIKGILLQLDNRNGEVRLFAPDFPDWIEDKNLGIKLAPDQRTTTIMKKALESIGNNPHTNLLFETLHATNTKNGAPENYSFENLQFSNQTLNVSQKQAVAAITQNQNLMVVHGPPGTGKTTTLIEGIVQLLKQDEKVLVSAPSNTAVDNVAKKLIALGVKVLRVGNVSKVDELVYKYTTEGYLANSIQLKEIKTLKKRAEEFRKMALKYKRNFGKAEREQRSLLFKEVKSIRAEIRKLQDYNEAKLFDEAAVIIGTPIGLYDASLQRLHFDTLIMDEAGQCLEPLAWCLIPLAKKYVLSGDHLQLPPTVLSQTAANMGFNISILEVAILANLPTYLLNTQYRMRESIAGFSSVYFYNNLLLTASYLKVEGKHLTFIDTAGSGFNESNGSGGASLQNKGELQIAQKLIETENLNPTNTAFVSPYAGQVAAAKDLMSTNIRMSTIDSFQGQECPVIILSLVRSNDDGTIGFLKDYRRMNVAITRAKEHLYVIGDSATVGANKFYQSFLEYVENNGNYRTVWEFDLEY
jgi:ATP-dependent RNA/DNA helicase IGHMBP2